MVLTHERRSAKYSRFANITFQIAGAEETRKSGVILDVSYGEGGRSNTGLGVNGNTDLERAQVCELLRNVMERFMKRVCGLREQIGPEVAVCFIKYGRERCISKNTY